VACVFLFSRRVHDRLQPILRIKVLQDVYVALHSFRSDAGLLAAMLGLTVVVQAVRVLAIWCAAKAVGIDLSPLPYYVMGPLLFLVMLVPFTVNGLAVRESFFVSFLGTLGIGADPAFAAGFLFFLVTVALAFPGLAILARGAFRR
jgi:uncharacterized membrane protein YbhN (UPF0104 family)